MADRRNGKKRRKNNEEESSDEEDPAWEPENELSDSFLEDESEENSTLKRKIVPETYDENLSFKDVGGLREIKKKLIPVIARFTDIKQSTKKAKASPPKGILFHGPPGTGKTLMAKCFLAELNRCSKLPVSFYTISGDIKNKYYGETEKQLKSVFAKAKDTAPSVILFDEFEALASSRQESKEEIASSVVSYLLVEMGNLPENVLLIAITNIKENLDPAIIRPGRVDISIEFSPPNEISRAEILNTIVLKWKRKSRPSEETVDRVAKLTQGFSGADLQKLVTTVIDETQEKILAENDVDDVKDIVDKLKTNKVKISSQNWISAAQKMRPTDMTCFGSCLYTPRLIYCPKLIASLFGSFNKSVMRMIPEESKIIPGKLVKPILIWTQQKSTNNSFALDLDCHILPGVLNILVSRRFVLYSINSNTISTAASTKCSILKEPIAQAIACDRPSIIFLPSIDTFWTDSDISVEQKKLLYQMMEQAVANQVQIIATSSSPAQDFGCPILQNIFCEKSSQSLEISAYSITDIRNLYADIVRKGNEKFEEFAQEILANREDKTDEDEENEAEASLTSLEVQLKEECSKIEEICLDMSVKNILSLRADFESAVESPQKSVESFVVNISDVVANYEWDL